MTVRDRIRRHCDRSARDGSPLIVKWLLGWLLVHNRFMVRWQIDWIVRTYPRYVWWNVRHFPFHVRYGFLTEDDWQAIRRNIVLVVVVAILAVMWAS